MGEFVTGRMGMRAPGYTDKFKGQDRVLSLTSHCPY